MRLNATTMIALCIAVLSVMVPGDGVSELADEQMREIGLTEEQIRMLRGETPAPETKRPTVEDYIRRGRTSERALTNYVGAAGSDGLALAREVLLREERRGAIWLDYGVFNGLARHNSQEVVDVLEEAVLAFYDSGHALWEPGRIAWASAFYQVHADATVDRVTRAVSNLSLSDEVRGLHLFALSRLGRSASAPGRSKALTVNRTYLKSGALPLQRAAVWVSRALWDHEALGELQSAAFESNDPFIRLYSYNTVEVFLTFGPDSDALPRDVSGFASSPNPYDAVALREWQAQRAEWRRRNYRIEKGREAPPGWPGEVQLQSRPPGPLPSAGPIRDRPSALGTDE